MQMFYLINRRFPTERGHGLQIAKMIDAFKDVGYTVKVFGVEREQTPLASEIKNFKDYYNLKNSLTVKRLYSLQAKNVSLIKKTLLLSSLISWLDQFICAIQVLRHTKKNDLIYTRDEVVAIVVSFFRSSVFLELHYEPQRTTWIFREGCQFLSGVIVNTEASYHAYRQQFPLIKILKAENGIDPGWLSLKKRKNQDKKITIGYSGNLYHWKGIDTLIEALDYLPKKYHVKIIGGSKKEHKRLSKKYKNYLERLTLIPHLSQQKLQNEISQSDILVVPFSATENHARFFTSPLKLYEYMATGIPVVASDIPSVRNLVNEDLLYWFKADSSESLANTIQKVRAIKADKAKAYVAEKTWYNRATMIKDFINSCS